MSSPSPNMSREAIREFLVETQESLEQVENELVALERNPHAADASSEGVARMFRTLHSIKGTCSFLGYPKLEELAHVGESLLGRIREGILPIDATVVTALLSVVDAIREVLGHIESENDEGNEDYSNLTQQLSQILSIDEDSESLAADAFAQTAELHGRNESVKPEDVVDDPGLTGSSAEHAEKASGSSGEQDRVQPAANNAMLRQSDSIVGDLVDSSSRGQSNIDLSSSRPGSERGSRKTHSDRDRKRSESKAADSTLRIEVSVLDKMMMLAGELVLARNQILQDQSLDTDGRLDGVFRQLNTITTELQSCIMKSRMRPIATIWQQMPRMVRDVALAAFKKVRLEMEGGDAELDKTIIEAIRDPLTHVLRNSVDHGIELPELRSALGKPAEGRLWMRAYHAGGQISIEIGDDGAGIDAQAIRRKALERNLVTPGQIDQMSGLALLNLIFQTGFSTTQRVTRLSGRGVGLDVVKSNIEKLGGAIHVQSTLGEGTTFTLRIPLTLAIVQSLIVKTAGDSYAVPLSRIVELIRLRGEEARAVLDSPSGVPDFRFRQQLLPIVHLRDLLELEISDPNSPPRSVNLVVLKVHDRHFGLVVDQILDDQEVVIKPLWQPLRAITTYAGATQLADGTVALILDPVGLAKRAGLVSGRHEDGSDESPVEPEPDDGLSILLARLDQGDRIALPASGLKRIEKVTCSRIRNLHGQPMMEHDGRVIRLIDVASLISQGSSSASDADNEPPGGDSDATHIAMYTANGGTVGLIVGPHVDVLRHAFDVREESARAHVQFTAMIDDQLVEVLDVDSILGSLEAPRTAEGVVANVGE